ncbi:uncharacterized protein LOC131976186 [Centropristis striata]|uniref:uncharacterized protein LOC131976186 n=1 Tax=Centropristis striata TaxID=184440 RepID=UPI0027E07E85|nr:uncharacterized protein LOC131976186 [Centropristis striata]
MLCPAAVNAAAAAVWLLAVLGPGLSHAAEDSSEQGFSLCGHCFYRQTPPQGASAGPLLRSLCHRLPGGQAFATLSRPTCDTAVYSAFHLSHDWTEREEGDELGTEEEDIEIAVPALLRGGQDPSPVSPTDSPLQHWDSTVTTLVQSSIIPQCSSLGGDLYILTGAGGLGAAEDGDEECQAKPLWSAVCCAVPEGTSGFSLGLIRETEGGERQVSVEELEEVLGVAELFSEGCGGAAGDTVGIRVGLHSEGLAGNIEDADADLSDENTDSNAAGGDTDGEEVATGGTEGGEVGSEATEGEEVGSEATSQDSNADTEERTEPRIAGKKLAGADAQPEAADAADVTQETSADAATSESSSEEQRDVTRSRAVRSESPESSADDETVQEQEKDTNSSSTLVYILSTTLSILKAPLQPLFSTVTQLPGQVTYVLQEDLGVLSALPGETFSLFHLLTSDFLSWTCSAGETLLGIGECCFSSMYYCSSSMLGALLDSCHTGVTGVGTLAGDTAGIFGDALDNAWWVTKFFGGRLWENSEGYVGSVVSEMGGQAKAVGGGFWRLVWRSGNGVGNVFRTGGGLIMGVVNMFTGAMRGAFGEEE